jgi:hypothetical protein
VAPPPIDPLALTIHEKKEIKSQWVIFDVVKDHLIPHLSKKKTTKEMFDSLVELLQSNSKNRKMVLRNKLRSMQMSRFDNFTSYFMSITRVHDQLVAIGEKVDDVYLINVAFNGFPKSWEPFAKGVCAREKILDWYRIWDNCIQEETREESKAWELFRSLTEKDLGTNVELGDDSKYAMKGEGTIWFHL